MPVVAYLGNFDTTWRLNGNGFPSLPVTGNFLSARDNMSKLFKAHNIVVVGDSPDSSANDFPSLEYSSHTSGATYSLTNGYGNARGVGKGDPIYIIGMYGSWQTANWSTTIISNGSTGFCDNVSSWTAYCVNNNLNCALYTPLDETNGTNMASEINRLSTWMSTVTACAYNGNTMNFMQTGDLPIVASSAPFVSFPTSAVGFDDAFPSSMTWQVIASSIMAGNGPLGNQGQVWRYGPGDAINEGAMYPYEEEGYPPEGDFWGMWKKICYDGARRMEAADFFMKGIIGGTQTMGVNRTMMTTIYLT